MKMKSPFKNSDDTRKAKMMRIGRALRGIVSGVAFMYFFDPQMGGRRRALLRDRVVKMVKVTSERLETAKEMMTDRAQGMAAETRRRLSEEEISDETLVARVRSEMGRYVSHPHAIQVAANNGHLTLTGNILANEVQLLLNKLKAMRHVQSVDNRLMAHEDAANVPDLQGDNLQRGTP